MKKIKLFKLLALFVVLITSISTAWAGYGYNGESHVYLSVDGTTKYYKVSTESWPLGSVSLPGTWGGVLSSQTFNNVLNIQVKGGAVGGWIDNDNISGTLYYKVTNNTTTPSDGWTSVGGINANYTGKDGNNCFRYKNDYSVNVTPTTPGTYYLHIKITDGDSNNRTSYVKIVVPPFTVAGSSAVLGTNWDISDTNNDMTFSSGTSYTLTKSNVELATGTTYECKVVVNHNYGDGSYPASNKQFTVSEDGHYDVTFTFNASTHAVDVTTTRLYLVTYNANGSTGGTKPDDTYHAEGATVTVAAKGDVAKAYYTFGGWNTANDGSGTNYTAGSGQFTMGTSTKTLYAKWTQGTTVAKNDGSGNTTTYTATWNKTSIDIASTPSRTGYTLNGYYAESGCSNKIAAANGNLQTSVTVSGTEWTSSGLWAHAATAATIYAGWTANTYTITLNGNGGEGNTGSVKATYNSSSLSTSITNPTKTGYNFDGWYSGSGGTGTLVINTSGVLQSGVTISATAWTDGSGNWVKDGGVTLYAKWSANEYTLTFYKNGEAWSDAAAATTKTRKIVYDQAYSTSYESQGAIPSMALKNGYRFDGWFTASSSGTQLIEADGTWKSDIDGILDGSSHWVQANNQDLYAQYSAGTITDIDFYLQSDWSTEVSSVPGDAHMGAVADFGVTPDGSGGTNYIVSWQLQYNDGTPLASQPDFSYDELVDAYKKVKFDAPSSSGTYKLVASLRTGSDRSAGTVVNTATFTFIVASQHTVTVQYKDGSNNTLRSSGSVTVPAAGTNTVTAPDDIIGYSFHHWVIGDGVTCTSGTVGDAGTQGTATITISAIYDGSVTAVYNKKNMIYFYNTLGWSGVTVYFYSSDAYWNASNGTGTNTGGAYSGKYGEMTQIEGTDIWYYDCDENNVPAAYDDVVFTEYTQNNYEYFSFKWDSEQGKASNIPNNVIRRGDYSSTLPMFVPLTGIDPTDMNSGGAKYYFEGYWMNYPENSGYTLKIYDNVDANKATGAIRSIAFPYSADKKMPLKLDVEFNDGYNHNYWFMVYRNDGTYLGSLYHFKQGYQDEQIITGGENKNKITTSAPGNYTFILTYHDNGSGTVNYYIDVDYPIASGDYRVYYSDNATWSQGAHTKDSWCHPSHSIAKATTEAKKDTVSFFVPKGVGISHTMKFQKASVTNEGVVSWADVAGGSITIPSSITETGIYNFIVSQPAGGASISLEKAEPYTGNFYVRTDCAGNTKWDSYKSLDHQMTYSDFADEQSVAAADTGFTHYYAHWVDQNTNVKFCIANDYSPCISDTLIGDNAGVYATIDGDGKMTSAGASIRFMWNRRTNRIKRSYLSGSSNISDRFLVLEGDSKMYDENGNALSISGLNANEANMIDDQNFVYERTIQVNTSARAKLTAKYNNKVQYFKGSAGDFAEGTTVELLGGDAVGKHTMRIVYDFKTDRLVTAYVPSSEITSEIEIHADLMIVRNHQGYGQQLTFSGKDAKLTDVKTVYGVMQFNRWTLNNRDGADDQRKDHCNTTAAIAEHHAPLDPVDQKSAYERGLYWISFPFDVNLSDVFGFGTYGTDWIIMYYDGAKRAQEGYWADSEGFWTYVMPSQRASFTLEKGKGYVLALDLDRMLYNNESCWANDISQVELFFPSTAVASTILATDVDVNVPAHTCEIGPRFSGGDDRTKKDSHWNVIGVPSYANYGTTLLDVAEGGGTTTINWQTSASSNDIPYLYEWQMYDNSYIVRSGTSYEFQSMHSYMVQYHGTMRWQLASATPPSVAARLTETPDVEYMLSLIQDSIEEDRTYVRMTDKEGVTIGFEFKDDLCKEYNSGRANIWTVTADTVQVAGNSQPHPLTTTIVPVGVKIAANGEYTFSMPEGTNGGDVWLIDNANSSRTNLGLMDYTVNLTTGTYEGRFSLEFPVQNVVTEIENAANANANANADVRKVFVGGRLYILRDGKAYDATGAQVR